MINLEISELELRLRIMSILDLTSGFDPTDNTRWGHDTDCGDNDWLIRKAIAILLNKEMKEE